MTVFLIIWFFFGICSAMIASGKGRSSGAWFVLGLIFGPVALLLAMIVSNDHVGLERQGLREGTLTKCPHCGGAISLHVSACRHCGRDVALSEVVVPDDMSLPNVMMQKYGIVCDGHHYIFQTHRFDRLEDAVQCARAHRMNNPA